MNSKKLIIGSVLVGGTIFGGAACLPPLPSLCPPGQYAVPNVESWECWKHPTSTTTTEVPTSTTTTSTSTTSTSTTTTTSELPTTTATSTTSVAPSTTTTTPKTSSTSVVRRDPETADHTDPLPVKSNLQTVEAEVSITG